MTEEMLAQGVAAGVISLALGHPDPGALPLDDLYAAAGSMVSHPGASRILQYGPEQGAPELVDYLAERLSRVEKMAVKPENVMVTAGSTGAVDMITRLFAGAGGVVLVEAPSYRDTLHVFRDHRVQLVPVPIDGDGIIVDALAARLGELNAQGIQPRFLYTIPNFQNPSGVTIPAARREAVIELARQYNFLILEDDVYRDLAFEGEPPPSFYALSKGEQAISIGSFSKTLGPGLRLGWIAAAQAHIERCINCGTSQMGGGATPFTASLVAAYCRSGRWDAHMAKLRDLYRCRRDVMLAALEKHMPPGVTWTVPGGGFFIWLTLPQEVEAESFRRQADARKLLVGMGNRFFVEPSPRTRHIRLAFSFAAPADLEKGVQLLAGLIA